MVCQTLISKSNRVQNAAAWIVCQAPRRQHHSVDPLKDLYFVTCARQCWLYKIAILCYCNNLRILLLYSRHIDSRVSWGHLRQTYCQHSLHRQTLLLVGSHAAPHRLEQSSLIILYALLIVLLVSGPCSRLTCSQDICSWSAVRASDTLTGSFARYKFVTYLLTYGLCMSATQTVQGAACENDTVYKLFPNL